MNREGLEVARRFHASRLTILDFQTSSFALIEDGSRAPFPQRVPFSIEDMMRALNDALRPFQRQALVAALEAERLAATKTAHELVAEIEQLIAEVPS